MRVIGDGAFDSCAKLSEINWSEGIEKIGTNAFYGCGFTSLSFPASLVSFGAGTFSNCIKLETVELPENMPVLGEQAFFRCTALKSVTIPEGMTGLANSAFCECTSLESVSCPESITWIGNNCFQRCLSLTSVKLPSTLETITPSMLGECPALRDIVIPATVKTIGDYAFSGCASIESLELPQGMTAINKASFQRCASLKSINIPEGVTSIGNNAFYGCASLAEINIPDKVASIGESVFIGCDRLSAINVGAGNSAYASVDGVLYDKEISVLLSYPYGKSGEFSLPKSVKRILSGAFNQCNSITAVNFNEGLETIEDATFVMCMQLQSVILPQSLRYVGDNAFLLCSSVSELVLPNADVTLRPEALSGINVGSMIFPEGIKKIGVADGAAFQVAQMCWSLESLSLPQSLDSLSAIGYNSDMLGHIYSFSAVPPTMVYDEMFVVARNIDIHVPAGSADAYREAWGESYPSATFIDDIPQPSAPEIGDGKATLSWPVYSDDHFTGTPVRYELSLYIGDELVKKVDVDPSEPTYTFSDLEKGEYGFELCGFTAKGEMTYKWTGTFDITASGIDSVLEEKETVTVNGNMITAEGRAIVFNTTGMKVAELDNSSVSLSAGIYIVRTATRTIKVAIR